MRNLLLRFIINAIAIGVITSGLLPGIRIEGNYVLTLAITAAILGLLNAVVRPILVLLSCPFIFFTLGLILVAINALMLGGAAVITNWIAGQSGRVVIDPWWWALIGAVIVGIINLILERLLGVDERVRVRKVKEVHVVYQSQRSALDQQFDAYVSQNLPPQAPYAPPAQPQGPYYPPQAPYAPPAQPQPPYVPPADPGMGGGGGAYPPQPPPAQPPQPRSPQPPRAPWER
jgi:putative membrane protein